MLLQCYLGVSMETARQYMISQRYTIRRSRFVPHLTAVQKQQRLKFPLSTNVDVDEIENCFQKDTPLNR